MNKDPFKEYIKQTEPGKRDKGYAWHTAIGLQAVDGLKPSKYLIDHALELFSKCGKKEYFGRMIVEDITGLKSTRASELIKLLVDSEIIVPVTGHGKGKYRFQ